MRAGAAGASSVRDRLVRTGDESRVQQRTASRHASVFMVAPTPSPPNSARQQRLRCVWQDWVPPSPPTLEATSNTNGTEMAMKAVCWQARPVVSWCHGVFCRVPPPQERLPVAPARPEQHNTAASAMPCRAALVPPPPPLSQARPELSGGSTRDLLSPPSRLLTLRVLGSAMGVRSGGPAPPCPRYAPSVQRG